MDCSGILPNSPALWLNTRVDCICYLHSGIHRHYFTPCGIRLSLEFERVKFIVLVALTSHSLVTAALLKRV